MASQIPNDDGERQRAPRDLVKTYDSGAPVEYQTRAVAFLDVLGWGQAVEASRDNAELRRVLLNSIWHLMARTKDYVETETVELPSKDEFSQFSDSIVVSFPYHDFGDLARLLRFVSEFQNSMIMNGLPLRGGVTVGPLFHADNFVFGPAMNRAYELESKFAKFPRIIIDQAFEWEVEAAILIYPKHWPLVVRGEGGYYETEFLTGFARSAKLTGIIEYQIERWITQHQDSQHVLEKYQWLKMRWKEVQKSVEDRGDQ